MAIAMKTIVYRGGLIQFQIPSTWREEYSDVEGGMFYEEGPDSGTLRLTVITLSTGKELHAESSREILNIIVRGLGQGIQGQTRSRQDGNSVFRYEEGASERGMPLQVIYWVITQPLPPHNARIFTFSYTVLASQREATSVRRVLDELEKEVDTALLATALGIVSE